MAGRRVYRDPTAEKAARNLERWLRAKRSRERFASENRWSPSAATVGTGSTTTKGN